MEGALLDLRSRLEKTLVMVTVAPNNNGETVAQASTSSSSSSFQCPPSANGQLTPPAPPPQLCQRQQLSTRLHFKPLAMIASFRSTASLCFYDIGILPTYLQKNSCTCSLCFSAKKNCEEKSETVSRAHGIDQNNRNSIDEGQCSISHLVASHWEGVGFTFQCGLIGLLADSSD